MAGKEAVALAMESERLDSSKCMIVARGQIDLYSAPLFKESLLDAIEGGCNDLVVDLSDVEFMDSTALGVLIGAQKRLGQTRGTITIVSPDEMIRRIFEISGLHELFAIHATRDEL